MKGFKIPFVLIKRKDYTELKSLRNLFKEIMQMRADQKEFQSLPDEINETNMISSENTVDGIIKNLLIKK
jgi:hypothetical protein